MCENAFVRTTIDIPDELFREAKIKAAQDGIRLKDLITSFIRHGMECEALTDPPVRPDRSPLPVIIPSSGVTLPAFTNAELFAILDDEDAERHLGRNR